MTTHGDAVGPSAIPAVAPAPTPEMDTELPTAGRPPAVGAKTAARDRSSTGMPGTATTDHDQIPGGTGTTAPAQTDIPAEGSSDRVTGPGVSDEPVTAPVEPVTAPVEPVTAPLAADSSAEEAKPAARGPVSDKSAARGPVDRDPAAASGSPGQNPAGAASPDQNPAGAASPDQNPAGAGSSGRAPALPEPSAGDADEPEPSTEVIAASTGGPTGAARSEPQPPAEPPRAVSELAEALSRLRAAIGGISYPLVMPSADEAQRVGAALVAQLDDYLLPRLARLDAPLLVVVGGSTGAGKSTLVNSLVRAPVTASGVLRPTTRSPVLVCHPSDSPWFRNGDLLPGMTRTTEPSNDPHTLQLVSAPALGPGLAFLDAPDIDSVVDANRALAAQLLAAADLWLFVTTAARYADAVPWELLRTARLRGTVTALVLDRVAREAAGEISAHLTEMLAGQDMAAAPLFVLPESTLDGQGLLSEEITRPLHDWFARLAADANARAAVVRQTLDGALAALVPAVDGLAAAADDQAVAARSLDERVHAAYRNAGRTMEQGLQDGRLLRGEVLARWQEFIGTGEFLRSLESRVGQFRDRVIAAVTGRPAPGRNLQVALESQLITLMRGIAADAAEQAYTGWQAHPAGAALLDPSLGRASDDLPARAERLVRDWQRNVLELVRAEAADKRFVARSAAYAVNATGLAVMIAVFTSTAFIPTGAELAVGAGTTVAAQKVLEAIFGDQAIRTLAARARADLLERVGVLLDAEAARFTARTEAVGLDGDPGAELRQAADAVERTRGELALTVGPDTALPAPASDTGETS